MNAIQLVSALAIVTLLSSGTSACDAPTGPECVDLRTATIEVQKLGTEYATNRLTLFRDTLGADCILVEAREEWLVLDDHAVLATVERWRCTWCADDQSNRDGAF